MSEVEDFEVEKVIGKRIEKKSVQYFIKWKGYPDEDNTWEPIEHLDCPNAIAAYEIAEERKAQGLPADEVAGEQAKKEEKVEEAMEDNGYDPEIRDPSGPTGFDKGLTAKEILGVIKVDGHLFYRVKWNEPDEQDDLAFEDECEDNCPHLVIEYLQSKLTWVADSAIPKPSPSKLAAKPRERSREDSGSLINHSTASASIVDSDDS